MNEQTTKCKQCDKTILLIEEFPKGLCVDCYEVEFNKIPLEKLPKPDFTKAIRVK